MLLLDEGGDPEMNELAQAEIDRLEAEQAEREARMHLLLLPKGPLDDKNVIVEIRAARAAMRLPCLPVTCSACTRAGPRITASRRIS